MNSDTRSLVAAMLRHHGKLRALKLADKYAQDAMAKGDSHDFTKWSAVAAHIADLIDLAERFSVGL